jgi:hypothetical protein
VALQRDVAVAGRRVPQLQGAIAAVADNLPVRANCNRLHSVSVPFSEASQLSIAASQILRVLLVLPLTIFLPSGLMATERMVTVFLPQLPIAASQILCAPLPLTIYSNLLLPSGLMPTFTEITLPLRAVAVAGCIPDLEGVVATEADNLLLPSGAQHWSTGQFRRSASTSVLVHQTLQ